MTKTVLYIGWVGFGNLGDDLCFDILSETMSERAAEKGLRLEIKGLFPSSFSEFSLARMAPDLVVLGAGSLFEPVYLKPLAMAAQHSIPTLIWGSGYDSMLPGPLSPSLIDPDSAFMIRQTVQRAALIGVRGPYTLEMLEAVGAFHPDLKIAGDPGLLLKPQQEDASLPELESVQGPVIAVNWGTAANKVLGGSEQSVFDDLKEVLAALPKEFTVLIYSVWPRDLARCRNLYRELDSTNCLLLDRVPSRDELAALYRRSTLSVNMKLHANIFSAALDCPFVHLAYRMKGWDFSRSLNWTDLTVMFSDTDRREKIAGAIEAVLADAEGCKARLHSAKQHYLAEHRALADAAVSLLGGIGPAYLSQGLAGSAPGTNRMY